MGAVTTSMFFLYYFFYGTSYAKVSQARLVSTHHYLTVLRFHGSTIQRSTRWDGEHEALLQRLLQTGWEGSS